MPPSDPFAAIAASYDDWYATPLGAFVDRCELGALQSVLQVEPRGQILEIGAGTGHVSAFLAWLGFTVTAVEPSAAMRTRGKQATGGLAVAWCEGVAESLPFPDGTFDGALFFTALEFVAEPALAIEEAFRAVRLGGWLAIGYLHALSGWAALSRHQADLGVEPWTSARFHTREQLESLAGRPADASASAAWLGPFAEPPFEEADEAGRRAGNAPALEILLWRKPA